MNQLCSEPKQEILKASAAHILKCGRQDSNSQAGAAVAPSPGNSTARSSFRSRLKRAAGNERGQSLVEFTLAMPILLLLMTGMTSFGFAMHNNIILTNAVNAGAQQLAFSRGQTTDPCATANTI